MIQCLALLLRYVCVEALLPYITSTDLKSYVANWITGLLPRWSSWQTEPCLSKFVGYTRYICAGYWSQIPFVSVYQQTDKPNDVFNNNDIDLKYFFVFVTHEIVRIQMPTLFHNFIGKENGYVGDLSWMQPKWTGKSMFKFTRNNRHRPKNVVI